MSRFLVLVLSGFLFSALVHAADSDYVKGDGELDYECTQTNTKQKPFNYFYLTLMVSEDTDFDLIDLFDWESLFGEGNKNFYYKVRAVQFPHHQANILPQMQTVPGCELAPLWLTAHETMPSAVQFQCGNNGELGQGSLSIDIDTMDAQGTFYFPKEKPELIYPLDANTTVKVTCKQRSLAI